jgi:Peptidase family M1 domain/Peptidase M1 N-terminal domain
MRIAFILLLVISLKSLAQSYPDFCKSTEEIAAMERKGNERMFSTENLTAASTNFDVKYYRLEWEVDPAIRFIKGKVTVYYRILSGTGFIALDLMNDLVTDSVKQRNVSLINSQSNNTLSIFFSDLIFPGTIDSVSIYYKGIPPNTGFGSFVTTTHAGTPVMWSLSEPYGSRDWWPCKNGLDDKADSIDVFVTNPIAYRAASNGLQQSETPVEGGTKLLTHWKHRYPIASYLVCFAVTNYVVFNNTVQLTNGILPMQTHCYPESLTTFQNGTINTLNAMQMFDTIFGPYPFMNEKYGHVQFSWGGGMEHQTASFMGSIGESLSAHELAHQWFGDKITCGSWKDIWLNEGFATHLASMYMENKYPANKIAWRINEINSITSQPGGSVEVDDTTNVGRIFSGRLSYTKGSHLLYMLRWILGDTVFFNAIRNYLTDPAVAYGFARTSDLKRNLEQTSGRNLTSFFDKWFSGQGYPTYNVQWSNFGSGNLWIKMNQVTSHPSVSFFELPVALRFQNATQQATVIVENVSNGEVFLRSIGFLADTVIVDPEAWLITKNNSTEKLPAVLPVSLQNFDVKERGCIAFINFSTSFESNLSHFEIEVSNDGTLYTKTTTLFAIGNSNSVNQYYFQYPMQTELNHFFRIKMIDRDGSFVYSNVRSTGKCNIVNTDILITPNPSKNFVSISGLTPGKNTLILFDINGRHLQTIQSSASVVIIDLDNYSSGIFLLRVLDSIGNWKNQKIVKQ